MVCYPDSLDLRFSALVQFLGNCGMTEEIVGMRKPWKNGEKVMFAENCMASSVFLWKQKLEEANLRSSFTQRFWKENIDLQAVVESACRVLNNIGSWPLRICHVFLRWHTQETSCGLYFLWTASHSSENRGFFMTCLFFF